jgi:hypothetical protein
MEFLLDPESVYFRDGKFGISKEMALFCADGLRATVAAKSLKDIRFEKLSHIDGGFLSIRNCGFTII